MPGNAQAAPRILRFPRWAAATVSIAIALATLAADLLTPADLLMPVVFGIPIALSAWTRNLPFLWGLTAFLVAASVALGFAAPSTEDRSQAVAILNRSLIAVDLLAMAGLVHLWVVTGRAVHSQRHHVERQNAELEAINEELGQREEEIVRQNEELQSQTEELERQSEELRVTNEELAGREKMLEQLLELSRALTAELPREEVLKRICEGLGLLTSGMATAILDKEDDELVVRCHHGFGPEGPEAVRIPFAQSFSSMIMSLGQTGYLEDVRLRPDLVIPRPKQGEPFRSILSSPLRVHGRCVGVIEIYSSAPQSWEESQVAMIESLAAQASISLQGAELVENFVSERRRFEAAFRMVPFGMAIADDPEGKQVRMNPAGAAMFNVAPDENVSVSLPAGKRLTRSIAIGNRPPSDEELPLVRALRGEEVQGVEMETTLAGGRHLILLTSATPIFDARGEIAGAICGFADITAQRVLLRELELRRREAEEASIRKTRFLAAVSHDIRTPANAINLMAEVIRRSSSSQDLYHQIPELARKLQANTISMMEILEDLLDVARFDTGKIEVQESEFPLNDLLAEEAGQVAPLAQDKKLDLTVEAPDRPVWLRTDRVKLGRVLGNLIGNAIKFTEEGKVTVRGSLDPDPGRRVVIRVEDTGVGIPPEQVPLLFDEFAQLRRPDRERHKGTGLGLAISKRLVQVLGGTIDVQSTPGRGSAFTVTLPATSVVLRLDLPPRSNRPPRRDAAAAPADTPRGGRLRMRVLLVEDHPTSREGTRNILVQEGATVVEASDGRSALKQLEKDRFDVVLLDMLLPDIDGREILRALQLRRPGWLKAVLVLTADLTQERQDEIRSLGGDGLIGKPVEVEKLMRALEQYLGDGNGEGARP